MKTDIIIETTQNGEDLELVSREGSFVDLEKEYILSYMEDMYNNIININKETNIVTVTRKGLGREDFSSKLIFEFQKNIKCSIFFEDYTMFVDVNTINIETKVAENQLSLVLKYYINDSYNQVRLKAKF